MKPLSLISLLIVAAASAVGGYYLAQQHHAPSPAPTAEGTSGRRILYYQSGMHPWIKSDKPGKCTICGMPLTPVFEGDKSLELPPGSVGLNPNSIRVLNVQTEVVKRAPLKRSLNVAGTIDDNDSTHRRLSATIDGRIDKLGVPFVGAEVVQGQLLASFHSPMLLALEREYLTIHHQLSNAPAASRAELETMRKGAERRLTLVGMTPQQVEALAQKPESEHLVDILAPMSGTVVSKEVYEGQYVKEGDKLFELSDFSTMWFRFDVYEQDLPWIRLDQMVEVTTPSLPGRVFRAPIRFIDPNLSDATRTAKIRVDLPNPLIETNGVQRREILHRLYADGKLELSFPDVLSVPRTAVLNPGGHPVVYVTSVEGIYQQRPVTLGRLGDSAWEVLDGLKEGELVVTHGNLLIDSQAQLNSSSAGVAQPSTSSAGTTDGPLPSLNTDQTSAAQAWMLTVGHLSQDLAKDDLQSFNTRSKELEARREALGRAFPSTNTWSQWVAPLLTQSTAATAKDLTEARRSFYAVSAPTVEWAKRLKSQSGFSTLKLFQCPMTNRAFPGAPKSAAWLQTEGTLQNPYFGSEMIDCGTELKP